MSEMSMMALFQSEVTDHGGRLREALPALLRGDEEALERAQRAVHAIRGAARLVEVEPVAELAGAMEQAIGRARDGALDPTVLADLLERGWALVEELAGAGEAHGEWMAAHGQRHAEMVAALGATEEEAEPATAGEEDSPPDDQPPPEMEAPVSEPAPQEAAATDQAPADVADLSMLELFRMETEQQSAVLSDGLLALEQDPANPERIEPLMRAAHSIKGAARLVGIQPVVDLAHVMEDGFVAAQEGRITIDAAAIDIQLAGVDTLRHLAFDEQAGQGWLNEHRDEYDRLMTQLRAIAAGEAVAGTAPRAAAPEAVTEAAPEPDPAEEKEAEPPPAMAVEDMSMFDLFKVETEQQSAVLTDGLLALEQDPANPERLEPLMRAAHSIKGAARLVGIQPVVDLAHAMEDGFVAAQEGRVLFDADRIDAMLAGVDVIQHLAADPAWLEHHGDDYRRVMANVEAVLSGAPMEPAPQAPSDTTPPPQPTPKEPSPAASSPAPESKGTPVPQKDRVIRVSAEQIDRLMGLAGESIVDARWLYPFAGSLQRLKRQQTDLVCILDSLRDHLDGSRHEEVVLELAREAQKQASYCREMLADRLAELEAFDRRASNLSSRLHQEVVKSRMRPFGDGIHGFPRMVRDVARKLGKSVQLIIEGETTLVDRDILDKLEAPLNHIIRNAIDHGLETEEERIAAGKPPKGTIRLRAYHHAGMLSVVVEDDGRGVDLERLRRKVIEKGLVDEAMGQALSEAELLDFLFLPSFSTRDSVSEISGRGVGLDVVHDVVQEMRGSVRATTRPGRGTRFHMQLPLTLSVIPALLVEVAEEPYAFPLARIDRILRIDNSSVQEAEGSQFISVEGKNIGLVGACQILGVGNKDAFPESLSVVVLNDRNRYYGMVVERFIGERDLVVQVMPPKLGKVQDISAAALMEDGSPVLIVDVDDLIRSIEKVLKVSSIGKVAALEEEQQGSRKRILVVDDSITVREVERKLLQSAGYQVEVAVDGVDGLNALYRGDFDLLITDVDMPRMNGIELTRTVRQDPQLRSIPIMMVSYKDREEDRLRGLEAGADYYLTKSSFHDESLRNVVIDLIGEAES